jgi:acyl carrier protein
MVAEPTPTERLSSAFRTALALPADTDVTKLHYAVHEKWDSVAHLKLVAELEHVFDVMLDADEILAMSSYDKAVEILKTKDVAL